MKTIIFNNIERKAKKYKELKAAAEKLQKEIEALRQELISLILTEGETDPHDPKKGKLTAGLYKLSTYVQHRRDIVSGVLDDIQDYNPDWIQYIDSQMLRVS